MGEEGQEGAQERADKVRAEIADLLDLQLSPLGLAVMDRLAPAIAQTVLDVGCGAGQTLVQLAERVGETGQVCGVDIGAVSLAKAKSRTTHLPQVKLFNDDAATLKLADASLDGIYSRFGVMFFAEPAEAFSNFRRMLRLGGRIGFVCWRSLIENELDALPLNAAKLHAEVDEAQFSFERPEFVTDTLQTTGFGNIDIRPFDTPVSSGDVDDMMVVLTKVGALGKILRETPGLLSIAEPRVRAALLERKTGDQVSLNAATWIVTATAI